jgi:glycosyltransferase involved in cell wall biosynthesis
MQPEISIVIPTFRRPLQLREALQSALSQSEIALEIFVVDDSPEGSARAVVEGFGDSRIGYIKNPNPSGGIPSIVRNMGLKKCRGEFVHFLDDDDVVPQGYYQGARREFAAKPRAGVIFGHIKPFGDCSLDQLANEKTFFNNAQRRAEMCSRLGVAWPFVGQMLFGQVLLVCSSAILRRECVQALGGFDPNIVLHEDRDLFVRVIRRYGARFLNRVSLHYRIGYPSLMHAAAASAEQMTLEQKGNRLLKEKYMKAHGRLEYYALKAATKVLNKAF